MDRLDKSVSPNLEGNMKRGEKLHVAQGLFDSCKARVFLAKGGYP